MEWINLTAADQVAKLAEDSYRFPVLIFKFSTRCSTSRLVFDRLERRWNPDEIKGMDRYLLDLIRHRPVSDLVAHRFGVPHESPQVLVIRNGQAVYHDSHYGIDYDGILEAGLNIQSGC